MHFCCNRKENGGCVQNWMLRAKAAERRRCRCCSRLSAPPTMLLRLQAAFTDVLPLPHSIRIPTEAGINHQETRAAAALVLPLET